MTLREFTSEEFPKLSDLQRKFVLGKLELVKNYFSNNEAIPLRKLANDLIKIAVLRNDAVLARVSLIAYSLHKILTKVHFVKDKKWNSNKRELLKALNKAIDSIKKHKIERFPENLDSFALKFEKIDRKLNSFLQSIYSKARLKYAADAFYLGMSLGKAASLTGADAKALQQYVSFTKQFEKPLFPEPSINERLSLLEKAIK